MKCPHCGYEHGWSSETLEDLHGEDGGFYTLPIELVQKESYYPSSRQVLGCPSCNKLFME